KELGVPKHLDFRQILSLRKRLRTRFARTAERPASTAPKAPKQIAITRVGRIASVCQKAKISAHRRGLESSDRSSTFKLAAVPSCLCFRCRTDRIATGIQRYSRGAGCLSPQNFS